MTYNRFVIYSIFIFSLLTDINLNAQGYKFLKPINNVAATLNVPNTFRNQITFKEEKGHIYTLIPPSQNSMHDVQVIDFNLDSNKVQHHWKFDLPVEYLPNTDFCIHNGNFYFAQIISTANHKHSTSALFCYNLKNKKISIYSADGKNSFRQIHLLNDSLLLLSDLYAFHPADGIAKAQLYIYNLHKNKVTYSRHLDFEGISISNIVNQWINIIAGEICIVTPLTGKLVFFNNQLIEKDSLQINLPFLNTPANKNFIYSLDSFLASDIHDYNEFIKSKSPDFLKNHSIQLDFFRGKGEVAHRIQELRNQHSYIEKVLPYNDSIFILSVYRPKLKLNFRSLYFVNIKNGKIQDSIPKWRCISPENGKIKKMENYFTVDLGNSHLIEPLFYKGNVYFYSTFPTTLFTPGLSTDEMNNKLFNWEQKNKHIWELLEYKVL